MKAATFSRYGAPEVVTIAEYPNPVAGPREVLVRIRATTVSSGDTRIRGLRMPPGFGWAARPAFGFFGPRQPILGTEFAGRYVSMKVRRFCSEFKQGLGAGTGHAVMCLEMA